MKTRTFILLTMIAVLTTAALQCNSKDTKGPLQRAKILVELSCSGADTLIVEYYGRLHISESSEGGKLKDDDYNVIATNVTRFSILEKYSGSDTIEVIDIPKSENNDSHQ